MCARVHVRVCVDKTTRSRVYRTEESFMELPIGHHDQMEMFEYWQRKFHQMFVEFKVSGRRDGHDQKRFQDMMRVLELCMHDTQICIDNNNDTTLCKLMHLKVHREKYLYQYKWIVDPITNMQLDKLHADSTSRGRHMLMMLPYHNQPSPLHIVNHYINPEKENDVVYEIRNASRQTGESKLYEDEIVLLEGFDRYDRDDHMTAFHNYYGRIITLRENAIDRKQSEHVKLAQCYLKRMHNSRISTYELVPIIRNVLDYDHIKLGSSLVNNSIQKRLHEMNVSYYKDALIGVTAGSIVQIKCVCADKSCGMEGQLAFITGLQRRLMNPYERVSGDPNASTLYWHQSDLWLHGERHCEISINDNGLLSATMNNHGPCRNIIDREGVGMVGGGSSASGGGGWLGQFESRKKSVPALRRWKAKTNCCYSTKVALYSNGCSDSTCYDNTIDRNYLN